MHKKGEKFAPQPPRPWQIRFKKVEGDLRRNNFLNQSQFTTTKPTQGISITPPALQKRYKEHTGVNIFIESVTSSPEGVRKVTLNLLPKRMRGPRKTNKKTIHFPSHHQTMFDKSHFLPAQTMETTTAHAPISDSAMSFPQ